MYTDIDSNGSNELLCFVLALSSWGVPAICSSSVWYFGLFVVNFFFCESNFPECCSIAFDTAEIEEKEEKEKEKQEKESSVSADV